MTDLRRFEHKGFSLGSTIPSPHNEAKRLGNYHPPININPEKYRLESLINGAGKIVFNLDDSNGEWTRTGAASFFQGLEFEAHTEDSIIWTGNEPISSYHLKKCIITLYEHKAKVMLQESLTWVENGARNEFNTFWFWIPN